MGLPARARRPKAHPAQINDANRGPNSRPKSDHPPRVLPPPFLSSHPINRQSPNRLISQTQTVIMGVLNARFAARKAALLHDTIFSEKLDLLAVTETWIPSDAPTAHHWALRFSIDIDDPSMQEGEAVPLLWPQTICVFDLAIIVCVVYRPPPTSVSEFLEDFEAWARHLSNTRLPIVICGDFNLSKAKLPSLRTLLNDNHMTQLVNSPTHDKGDMLDLLITKRESSSLINDLKVAPVCYSGHSLITLRLCARDRSL